MLGCPGSTRDPLRGPFWAPVIPPPPGGGLEKGLEVPAALQIFFSLPLLSCALDVAVSY